jgi:hypothetical protein
MTTVRESGSLLRSSQRPRGLTLGFCALLAFGCGGDDGGNVVEPPTVQPPVINVSAQPGTLQEGGACLFFNAIPQENVVLFSVAIKDPLSNQITFPLGGVSLAANQPLALQEQGTCYVQRSGAYTFTFSGNRPGGEQFTTITTYNQS